MAESVTVLMIRHCTEVLLL